MCGQDGFYGTSAFSVYLNMNEVSNFEHVSEKEKKSEEMKLYLSTGVCTIDNLKMTHNLKQGELETYKDNAYELDI